jgi:hypothetical protein
MLVYNLTQRPVVYKGKPIPPDGGSLEFGDMDFIPTRDRDLETAKILSFGSLPRWWTAAKASKAAQVTAVVTKPGSPNRNGDVFPEKLVVTMDAPVDHTDKPSFSMSTKKK